MNAKDRAEAAKWLRLGYETYGLDGIASVARAMGVSLRTNSDLAGDIDRGVIQASDPGSTTTSGSDTFPSNEWSSPGNKFRYGSVPKVERPPLACPPAPPRDDPTWRRYDGNPSWFHCGFEGFLENRKPSPDRPIGECFYDRSGRLVDEDHPYAGCQGTPNQFESKTPDHVLFDDGGIARNGWRAGWESLRYFRDEQLRREEQFRRLRRSR